MLIGGLQKMLTPRPGTGSERRDDGESGQPRGSRGALLLRRPAFLRYNYLTYDWQHFDRTNNGADRRYTGGSDKDSWLEAWKATPYGISIFPNDATDRQSLMCGGVFVSEPSRKL